MTEPLPVLSGHDVKLIDPVCGMSVTEGSEHHHIHESVDYYFCSSACRQKFTEQPEKYLNPAEEHFSGKHSESAIYTCPMHPEVEQQEPGSCPKCGMALEAKSITEEEDNTELIEMKRRFWISAVLAFPVFVLAMLTDMAPALLPEALSMQSVQWIEFILATPVVIWGGWPFFVRGIQSVLSWNLNMFTLIGLGVSIAWSYSLVGLLLPEVFLQELSPHAAIL